MMDFGYLGSSSNLSPLAPPFTLDRTFPKPNTENYVNFTDPSPAMPFSSPLSSWQYTPSSTSNPSIYPKSTVDSGVDSIRTTYASSENYYPYFGVPSITSPNTQTPQLNASLSTTPEAFAFSKYSSEIPTTHVEGDVPLVVLSKPDYDLSSTSNITPLDGSSQVDYHQSLSGLNYKPQWGSYWDRIDRLADGGEKSKKVDYNAAACSIAFQTYKQASSIAEGFSIGKDSSTVPHLTCLNLLGGESQISTQVTNAMDYRPFSTQGSSFTPYTFPNSHANVSPVEASTTFLNHKNPYASQDQDFPSFNIGKIGSVTIKRPSPSLVIRSPSKSNSSNIKRDFQNKPLTEKIEINMSNIGLEPQIPVMSAPPYSFISTSDRAKSVSSVEGPMESLDRNYAALDSPCWKGSSSFNFSPFENNAAVTSDHLVKKPESLSGLKLQQNQVFTPFEENAKTSGQKVNENYQENGYVELGSLLCPVKVDNSICEDEVDNVKMSGKKIEPFFNNIHKLTKEYGTLSDLKSCKQAESEKDLELGFGVAGAGLSCASASSELSVKKLVDTIHNLSELLLLQCPEDMPTLSVVGHETLKLAMKNLDAFVSKIVAEPTEEINHYKSAVSGKLQVTKEASSHPGFDNSPSHQGSKNTEHFDKEVQKFTNLFSARVNEDFEKDDKVTRGIKKVLEENFITNEKNQLETLLYKNLWLEAEATLCSVSFRARYDRMKAEMDKYKSPKTKEPAKTFEELYNEVFPDPSSPGKGNPLIEAFKMLHKSSQDPSASEANENINDASIKSQLDILNNRVPSQNCASEEDQTDEEADAAFAETVKTVEKLLSSEDTDDWPLKGPTHARGKNDNDVEARVMARFQLLKSRDSNVVSENSGQPSKQSAGSEISGEKNPWCFNGVPYDHDSVNGPLSQISKFPENKQDYLRGTEGVKDSHVCAPNFQIGGNEKMVTQLSSGWCDGSLSDWEDVLKDDHCR